MRFTFVRRGVALSAALLSALAVAAAGASSAGATSGSAPTVAPTWSAIQPYQTLTSSSLPLTGSLGLMMSVTCPSYGNCVAAGLLESGTGAASPALAIESDGQWESPIAAPLPANGQAGAQAGLSSVSCSSASSCVAVGYYTTNSTAALGRQALAVPFTVSGASVTFGTPQQVALPSGALATSSQGAFLSGVSCAATCTAVGTYQDGSGAWTAMMATPAADGAWSATAVAAPTGATNDIILSAISCPSSGACEAVGSYGDSSSHLQSWVVPVSDGTAGTSQAVTLPAASTASANAPEPPGFVLLEATGLDAISCPSDGVCTAVGTFETASSSPEELALPITQGTAGSATVLDPTAVETVATGISCWDAGDCVATGAGLTPGSGAPAADPLVTSEVGGSWSATEPLQGPPPQTGTTLAISLPESVGCSAPGICVVTGFSLSEVTSGSTSTETAESYFAYSAVPPAVTTTSLPAAKVGVPYTATLASSGGAGSSSWSVTAGLLPAGLTLDASTGVISGTPTATGQSGFIVTATNAGPPSLSGIAGLSITVEPAAVTAAASPTATPATTPAPTPTPSVAIAYLSKSSHRLVLVLSCSGAACKGKLKLTGVEHLKGKTVTGVAASARHGSKRHRTRKITLARGSYSLAVGHTQVRTLKLSKSALRLLHRLHRISAELTVTPTGTKKPAIIRRLKFKA